MVNEPLFHRPKHTQPHTWLMRSRATPNRPRLTALAAAVTAAVLALTTAACSESVTTPAAAPSAGSCANPDYCAPASWDTAKASTPLPQIPAFTEPLNVVISARSTVTLANLQAAMTDWHTVSTASSMSLTGIHLKCISSEQADVTGNGYVPQNQAWRLGGCIDGNDLSLSGNEDHVRIWNQPVKGSTDGAWFVAASYETLCLALNGKLETASLDERYAALHPSKAYHCVDGGPGSFHAKHPDGYSDGAATFVAAIEAAAKSKGWHFTQQTITVPRNANAGEGNVPFNANVDVLTITT